MQRLPRKRVPTEKARVPQTNNTKPKPKAGRQKRKKNSSPNAAAPKKMRKNSGSPNAAALKKMRLSARVRPPSDNDNDLMLPETDDNEDPDKAADDAPDGAPNVDGPPTCSSIASAIAIA